MLAGVTVLTLVLSLVLRKDAPVIAFLLVLAAGAVLLWQVGTAAQDTVRRFSALLERGNLESGLYLPVRRAGGIAALGRILRRSAGTPGSPRLPPRSSLRAR